MILIRQVEVWERMREGKSEKENNITQLVDQEKIRGQDEMEDKMSE